MRCHYVDDAVQRKQAAQFQAFNHLERSAQEKFAQFSNLSENIFPAEPGQALVPDGGKQLLNAGVSDESFLLVSDCKLKPF